MEAKFGRAIQIRVEMVYDPRLPITDLNREQVKKFESAVVVRTREVSKPFGLQSWVPC